MSNTEILSKDVAAHARIDSLGETLKQFMVTASEGQQNLSKQIASVNSNIQELTTSVATARASQGQLSIQSLSTFLTVLLAVVGIASSLIYFTINSRLAPAETAIASAKHAMDDNYREIQSLLVDGARVHEGLARVETQMTRRSQLTYQREHEDRVLLQILWRESHDYDLPEMSRYMYESEMTGGGAGSVGDK